MSLEEKIASLEEQLLELKKEISSSSDSSAAGEDITETATADKHTDNEKIQPRSRSRIVISKLNEGLVESAEDSTIDEDPRESLRALLDAIANGSGDPKLDEYFKNRKANKDQKLTTFQTLWTLFPPGTLIYGKLFQGQDEVFIVETHLENWPRGQKFYLRCWAYDWDGSRFRRLPLSLEIKHFEESKPIDSLPFYPLEFHKDPDALREKLIERGKQYRRFCTASLGSQMFSYDGRAILVKKGLSSLRGNEREFDDDEISMDVYSTNKLSKSANSTGSVYVKDRVMVDFKSYFEYGRRDALIGDMASSDGHVECQCPSCRANQQLMAIYRTSFDQANPDGQDWDLEQYLICPPRVFGYILREKQWAQLQVDCLKDIVHDEDGNSWSEGLKLANERTKDFILDLVTGHEDSKYRRPGDGLEVRDIVERKGKGLVILLYGPPGVGKTSTAETVAIKAGKPLFAISVADVGTAAKHVESNLRRIFTLATTWQAILLIDEADIFLQSRSLGVTHGGNIERNALVSVFLRVLEYYQGILMLTTNQIAQFDVAVHSRIHIAIKYDDLDDRRAIEIFMNFLEPLNRDGKINDMKQIQKWLERDVHRSKFDGRQIRNVVTSALSLARARGDRKLDKDHLSEVWDNVHDFKFEFIRQYENYKTQQKGSN